MKKSKNFVLVTSPKEVVKNLINFNDEVMSENPDPSIAVLIKNMSHYISWYCWFDKESYTYLFAPSKYIGYSDMNASIYAKYNRARDGQEGLDGRATENVLSAWYEQLFAGDNKTEILCEQLEEFCAKFGKKPNSGFRLNILIEKPKTTTLEKDIVKFIWNSYKNISAESRKELKVKINKYKS